MDIKGLETLVRQLRARVAKRTEGADVSVVVGYTTSYAVYVHEDLRAKHGAAYNAAYIDQTPGKVNPKTGKLGKTKISWNQAAKDIGYGTPGHFLYAGKAKTRGENQRAKFLEEPARVNREVYAKIVREVLADGKTLAQALLLAGLRLQRDSQEIVPVDTGMLRASAFTRLDVGTGGTGTH